MNSFKKRLLFVLPFAPRLDAAHGGSRVMAHLLREHAKQYRVALLCFREDQEPPLDEELSALCEIVEEVRRERTKPALLRQFRLLVPLLAGTPINVKKWASPVFASRLRDLVESWRPDLVQIEYPFMGQYLPALDNSPAPRLLVVYEPGTESARSFLSLRAGLARFPLYVDVRAWKRFESKIANLFNAVVVLTERDKKAVSEFQNRESIVQIPLTVPLPACASDPLGSSPPRLLFFGNFFHPPNVDAALRLVREIFPRVRARIPEAKLYLVGDQPTRLLKESANDAVIVTGYVPDLEPYLDAAALVVVPLRLGGGMRVKVLEALAAGKAVIATPLAMAGLDIEDGKQIAIAESDQQFADVATSLLRDPQKRSALAAQARAWACANCGWSKPARAYQKLYEQLWNGTQGSSLRMPV